MNVGKTLFSQIMRFMPWKTFGRIVDQYSGDKKVRTLDCADLFRSMAFDQLTCRESLRDIEICLCANHTRLFHMGFKGIPARSTLSDAPNSRDWRIFHDLAMKLGLRVHANCMPQNQTIWTWTLQCMHWIPPQLICACLCLTGLYSAPPNPPLKCIPCLICAVISLPLSTSVMVKWAVIPPKEGSIHK